MGNIKKGRRDYSYWKKNPFRQFNHKNSAYETANQYQIKIQSINAQQANKPDRK